MVSTALLHIFCSKDVAMFKTRSKWWINARDLPKTWRDRGWEPHVVIYCSFKQNAVSQRMESIKMGHCEDVSHSHSLKCHFSMSRSRVLKMLPHEKWQNELRQVRDLTASVSRRISPPTAGTTTSADTAASLEPGTADVSQNDASWTSHANSSQEQSNCLAIC